MKFSSWASEDVEPGGDPQPRLATPEPGLDAAGVSELEGGREAEPAARALSPLANLRRRLTPAEVGREWVHRTFGRRWRTLVHPSHTMMANVPLLYCSKCGRHAPPRP